AYHVRGGVLSDRGIGHIEQTEAKHDGPRQALIPSQVEIAAARVTVTLGRHQQIGSSLSRAVVSEAVVYHPRPGDIVEKNACWGRRAEGVLGKTAGRARDGRVTDAYMGGITKRHRAARGSPQAQPADLDVVCAVAPNADVRHMEVEK